MEKIKEKISNLKSAISNGMTFTDVEVLNLLELIVNQLEKTKTVNINIEKLVETLNTIGTPEDAEETRKIITDALIKAIKDSGNGSIE